MKDNSWEQFGKNDPYWAVLTSPQFKTNNLDENSLNEFFETGEEHVCNVFLNLKKYFPLDNVSNIKTALDFGCGTGRILIPFVNRLQNVVGVDISVPMLKEAKKNLDKRGITNVKLLQSNDITKTNFTHSFDFIHTFIVLQHIPQDYGYTIIDKLISLLNMGGFGMIHFTYYKKKPAWKNIAYNLKRRYKLGRQLANLLQGKAINTPFMQMNSYDLVKVLDIFRKYKIDNIIINLVKDGDFLGACVYFKK